MTDHDDRPRERSEDARVEDDYPEDHASTGGSMIAGAVAGGVVGLAAGPGGAVVGAVGGALAGAAAERAMHVDEDLERMAAGEEQAPWVAPSAVETADPTVAAMLAVTDDHEHRFEDGRCSCGAAI